MLLLRRTCPGWPKGELNFDMEKIILWSACFSRGS
jgi:hypothetical protein